MPKYAPKNVDGLAPYVKTTHSWGKQYRSIVWAENLATAKREFGYTQIHYESTTLRRATPEDVAHVEP
jgi:hypothetical protein